MYDILVKNAKIIDGAGNPWYYGDIGINNEKISKIGILNSVSAKKIINAEGKFLSPGFIDVHSHSDFTLVINGLAESKIRQGVTTEINGNCGFSPVPVKENGDIWFGALEIKCVAENIISSWRDFEGYFNKLEKQGVSINTGQLIGHNALRAIVVGDENRKASEIEMNTMKEIVQKSINDGVLGLSTGLTYLPGSFAEKNEIIELCKLFNGKGIYVTHTRSTYKKIIEATVEAIEIGKESNLPIHISHFVSRVPCYVKTKKLIELIDESRNKGFDVTCDVFPYITGSGGLKNLLPLWASEGGNEKLVERLKDKKIRQQIKEEILKYGPEHGGSPKIALLQEGRWEKLWLVQCEKNVNLIGKNFEEIARIRKEDPFTSLFNILVEENGVAFNVGEDKCEKELEDGIRYPYCMIGSDGHALAKYGVLSDGKPHPRCYGTFPRFISEYVRKKKLIHLEEAIRKITSFPANRFNLKKRGLIKEGFYADIVIFDYDKIQDLSTPFNPHCYPIGIEYVIVNGLTTMVGENNFGVKKGKILRNKG